MGESDDEKDAAAPKRYLVWLGGGAALGAWFVMLYFMFGDVL